MQFVDNEKNYDPRVNLAIEEYLLRSLPVTDDILLFYINEPSIIVGRNQNALEEINREYVEAHNIHVVRRLSGGGAVYHDHGNLNYSLITRGGREDAINFKKFTAPVVTALNEMGIPAELSGRNDILVDGRKVSGTAIYSTSQGIVCHGTLLYKTDLTRLSDALNVKQTKIASKGIKSVRSRVVNISEFLKSPMNIEDFRLQIMRGIFAPAVEIPQYHLTQKDWDAIQTLSNQRYMTWEWNFGQSPAFNVQKVQRFPFGEIDARIEVENGLVQSIKFFGDFFGEEDVEILEKLLKGIRYSPENIANALQDEDIDHFFSGLSLQEFLEFVL